MELRENNKFSKICLVIQGVGVVEGVAKKLPQMVVVVAVAVAVAALVGNWLLLSPCAEAVFPFLASLSKHIN